MPLIGTCKAGSPPVYYYFSTWHHMNWKTNISFKKRTNEGKERLAIELGHLLTEDNISKDSLELLLVDESGKPAIYINIWLPKFRFQDLHDTQKNNKEIHPETT